MKLATVTFHCAYNYGAVLQAYALVNALQKLGHDTCVLDYWPAKRLAAAKSVWNQKTGARALVMNGIIAAKYFPIMKKRKRFDSFRSDMLSVSVNRYHNVDEILESQETFDAYITGSDQVWNPDTGIDPVYFLQFAKALKAKSVAYAPSIGLPKIQDKYKSQMATLISKVDALSSREHRGAEIINELTGRDAKVVVDPVFLLSKEDWAEVVKPLALPDKYILVYAVRRRSYMEKSINKLKKELGLPVVLIVGSNPAARGFINADYVMWDAGPQEFVSMFSNAAYVCTNSFHGTAFSLIFEKPFLTFPHTNGDSRVSSILKRANMEKNIVREGDPLRTEFNAFEGSGLLDKEINASLDYLKGSLN